MPIAPVRQPAGAVSSLRHLASDKFSKADARFANSSLSANQAKLVDECFLDSLLPPVWL